MPAGEQPTAVYAKISTVTHLLERLFAAPADATLLDQLEKVEPVELVTQASLDGTYALVITQLRMLERSATDASIRRRIARLHQIISSTSPVFFLARPPAAYSQLY